MAIQFQKAVKHKEPVKVALTGPSGAGKTFTALQLLKYMLEGTGKRIAAVDTERGSMSKYAHTHTCGGEGVCNRPDHFDFDVIEPDTFDPRELVETIAEAHRAGYGGILTDSLSHYWMGAGGELEMVDQVAARSKTSNTFAAWKTVTPFHTKLVDALVGSRIHMVVTMRSKTEYVIEEYTDQNGRKKSMPKKIGLQPVMRDGIEFEFDIAGELDQENTLTVSKSRCFELNGKVINRPGKAMALTLLEWAGNGTPKPEVAPQFTQAQPAPQPKPAEPKQPFVATATDLPENLGGPKQDAPNPAAQKTDDAKIRIAFSAPATRMMAIPGGEEAFRRILVDHHCQFDVMDKLGIGPDPGKFPNRQYALDCLGALSVWLRSSASKEVAA